MSSKEPTLGRPLRIRTTTPTPLETALTRIMAMTTRILAPAGSNPAHPSKRSAMDAGMKKAHAPKSTKRSAALRRPRLNRFDMVKSTHKSMNF